MWLTKAYTGHCIHVTSNNTQILLGNCKKKKLRSVQIALLKKYLSTRKGFLNWVQKKNNTSTIKVVSPNWLIDVHSTINWICFLFGFPEPGDDSTWATGERKGHFANLFKSVPRRTSHFEENASEVIFDGSRTKNYEVSITCCTYEIRVQSYNIRTTITNWLILLKKGNCIF